MGNSIGKPGVTVYDCNPSTQEAAAGGLLVCSRSMCVFKVYGLHSEFCTLFNEIQPKKGGGGLGDMIQ